MNDIIDKLFLIAFTILYLAFGYELFKKPQFEYPKPYEKFYLIEK
jgi:hypothetical protein